MQPKVKRMKNIYCTLDTETFGGAIAPKGIYHLGGIIHDRLGNILATFNYLIMEHYDEIEKDSYGKKNFARYWDMLAMGKVTCIDTEQHAIDNVKELCNRYGVNYFMAYNSGFDFTKTMCYQLIEDKEFIDIMFMAWEILAPLKKYQNFCRENKLYSKSKKSLSSSAESMFAFLTDNADYTEEHTAFEDSLIEMQIFLECMRRHKKFTKNEHFGTSSRKWEFYPMLKL